MEFSSDESAEESEIPLEVHSDVEDSDYSDGEQEDVTVADEDVVNDIYTRRLKDQRGAEYISYAQLNAVLHGGCQCSNSSSSSLASEAAASCFVKAELSLDGLRCFRQRWAAYRKSTGELKRELGKVLQEHRQERIRKVPGGGTQPRKSKQLYYLNSREVCIDGRLE